ncbi:MAG TPA: pseudouridine synthase [Steroidobacteraceae bacterium]|nr:pseudouridine synthase [Steroidobacteraceae bacterium]
MKLLKLIANLGYGSRKEVAAMLRDGRILDIEGRVLSSDDVVEPACVRIDGAPLDPAPGLVLMLNKPTGYTCSTSDAGALVYDLLPPRFRRRSPTLATVGRLDRDTTGLLLMTDNGALLHRIVSPRSQLRKVYEATLARDLRGDEGGIFASGKLLLESERAPLAPAMLETLGPRSARVTVTEGRYHQVRRMFAAVGNHVMALHRSRIGGLTLDELESGKWRVLDDAQIAKLFAGNDVR